MSTYNRIGEHPTACTFEKALARANGPDMALSADDVLALVFRHYLPVCALGDEADETRLNGIVRLCKLLDPGEQARVFDVLGVPWNFSQDPADPRLQLNRRMLRLREHLALAREQRAGHRPRPGGRHRGEQAA